MARKFREARQIKKLKVIEAAANLENPAISTVLRCRQSRVPRGKSEKKQQTARLTRDVETFLLISRRHTLIRADVEILSVLIA